MSYASFDPARARKPLSRRQLKEALALANEKRDGTEAERLSNVALVYSFGNELDLAIQTLTRATVSKGAKSWIWSDLAALYLARSGNGDLIEALSSSSRVLQSDNALPEALFNQALCLQKLALIWTARKAWLRYLRYDSDSPWAGEARLHLREFGWRVEEQDSGEVSRVLEKTRLVEDEALKGLLPKSAQALREYGEKLLGDWGDAWSCGRTQDAEQLLNTVRRIGRILSLKGGDSILARAVASIDNSRDYPGQTDRLANAHVLYKKGNIFLNEFKFDQARGLFYKSGALFLVGGSAFTGWARLRTAICDLQLFQYDAALLALKSLIMDLDQADSASLSGMTWWSIGLIHGILARPVEAVDAYRRSVELFAGLHEFENLAAAESLMATSYRDLGDKFLAWHHELAALRLLGQVHDPHKRFLILDEAGVLLRQSDNPAAALVFQDEMTAESAAARQPALVVVSLRKEANLCNELGLKEKAHRTLERAKDRLNEITDENAHSSLAGDLLLTESSLLIDHDPGSAMRLLTSALQFSKRTSNDYQMVDLLFQRAQAYLGLGNLSLARQDLRDAIDMIQVQRGGIPQASLQEQFLARARNLFELMAMLQLRSGDSRAALSYVESLRSGNSLFPGVKGAPTAQDLVSYLQASLPEDTVMVNYFFFGERTHVWLIRRSEIQDFDLAVLRGRIDREVKTLRRGMEHHEEDGFRSQMSVLWMQLLGGFSPWLRDGERIVFVPDGPLHTVPFAALWNEESQHYLLQDHQVTTAPSALAYVTSIERSRMLGPKLKSILAVGNPTLDRRLWPSLDSLNGAQREARAVAALYDHRKILVGDDATISEVGKLSGYSDIIHFASHALMNSDQPLLSMLLLSPDRKSGGQGVLYARDLYDYSLPKTRIIILAACSSLGEGSTGREGLSSFARPLLAIGVPAVVGSLWKIEDAGSSEFLVRFHQNLLKRKDPVEALRKTQLESLVLKGAKAAGPGVWAAFQILGS